MGYVFKFAETEAEYAGIHRLNHRTFAEELGQHETTPDNLLTDRLERTSRYVIALHEDVVVGMVAMRDQRPFSIEQRLADPSLLERIPGRQLEVRLLAIHPPHRNQMVMAGLLGNVIVTAIREGYDILLISGITGREAMYRKFGFVPLGPPVPGGKANFIPMMLRIAEIPQRIRTDLERWQRRDPIATGGGTHGQ